MARKILKSSLLVLIACMFAIQGALIYFATIKGPKDPDDKPTTLAADEPQVHETVDFVKDVGKDFSFDIISDYKITDKNLSDFASVLDFNNNVINNGLKSHNGYYTVTAPKELYKEGKSYKIELFNARFKDEKLKDNKTLTFSVFKPETENIEYNPNVKTIPKEKVKEFNPQNNTLLLEGDDYRVNDILMIPTFNVDMGMEVEVAYKIIDCQESSGNSLITYTTPTLNELYKTCDISKKYEADPNNVTFESEEYIAQQLLENPEIEILSRALYDMSDKSAQSNSIMAVNVPATVLQVSTPISNSVTTMNAPIDNYVPDSGSINLKSPIKAIPKKIELKFKSYSPVDVNISITWEIVSNDYGKVHVILSYSHTSTVENFFYSDDKETRQSTIQTSKNIISIEVIAESDLKAIKPFKKLTEAVGYKNDHAKRLQIQKKQVDLQKEADKLFKEKGAKMYDDPKYYDILNKQDDYINQLDEIDKNAVEALQVKQLQQSAKVLQNQNTDKARKELEKINTEIYKIQNKQYITTKDRVIQALSEQAKRYKRNPSHSNSVIPIVKLQFPLPYGFAITVDVGIVFDFQVQVVLKGSLVIKSTEEVGTISTENNQKEFRNNKTEVSAGVSMSGTVTFKVGIQIGVGISWAGIFNLKLQAEAGLYIRITAMGAIFIGDQKDLGLNSEEANIASGATQIGPFNLVGSVDWDAGLYYKMSIKVSINLWIFEISKTWDIFGDEISFLKHEDKTVDIYEDLVFESEAGLTYDKIVANNEKELERIEAFDIAYAANRDKHNIKITTSLGDEFIIGSNGIVVSSTLYNDITPTFTIDRQSGTVTLPNVYKRTINAKTQEVSCQRINTQNIYMVSETDVRLNGLTVFINDYFVKELDVYESLRLQNLGESSESLFLPVRIKKDPINVESVYLGLVDETTEIKVNETKGLRNYVYPQNASYQQTEYKIKKIVLPSGQELTENFGKYAYILNGKIATTTEIPIGSKIYISSTATHDNVESNILCLEVVRTPVTDYRLHTQNYGTAIQFDETLELKLDIYPQNATVNILNDETIIVELTNGFDLAELKVDENSNRIYKLKVITTDTNDKNELVDISVSVGDLTQLFTFRIADVLIKSVNIYNEKTKEPLPQNIGLMPGDSLKVYIVLNPIEASIYETSYSLYSARSNSGAYVSVSKDGEIKISPNAPVGMEIYLSAATSQINSISHKITIQKIPVKEVGLRIASGLNSIALNQKLVITADIYPLNASNRAVEFKILNDPELKGVSIAPNGLLSVGADAEVGSEIVVQAVVDGVESNVLVIPIITELEDKMPVTSITTNLEEFDNNIYVGGKYSIWGEVNEDATDNNIAFKIDKPLGLNIDYTTIGKRFFAEITVTNNAVLNDIIVLTVYSTDNTKFFESKAFNIKPVFANDINKVALIVGTQDLDQLNLAKPGDVINTRILEFEIDKKVYGEIEDPTYTKYNLAVLEGSKYIKVREADNAIIVESIIDADNPTVKVIFILKQPGKEDITKEIEFKIYVPVISLSIIYEGKAVKELDVDRNSLSGGDRPAYTFEVRFNSNGYATEKDYNIIYIGGNSEKLKHSSPNTDNQIFEVEVLKDAAAGMFLTIEVMHHKTGISTTLTLTVRPLNTGYGIDYSNDYTLSGNNKVMGTVKLNYNENIAPQLEIGKYVDVFVIGATLNKALSVDNYEAYGVIVTIISNQNELYISEDGMIRMTDRATAKITYYYKITITDGLQGISTTYGVQAYEPIPLDKKAFFYLNGTEVKTNNTNSEFFTKTSDNLIEMDFGTTKYSQTPTLSLSSTYILTGNRFKAADVGSASRTVTVTATAELDYNGDKTTWSDSVTLYRGFIYNSSQLNEIRNNTIEKSLFFGLIKIHYVVGNYKLINNGITYNNWTPIANFEGVFDGDYRELTLTINKDSGYIGFVGVNYGTIKNLTIKGRILSQSNSTDGIYIGMFAGKNQKTIENCRTVRYFSGTPSYSFKFISSDTVINTFTNYDIEQSGNTAASYVGGIAGYNNGEIKSCYNNSAIASRGYTGGIAGISYGYIYNGGNSGTIGYLIWAENRCIGGIVGHLAEGTVDWGYNYATISYLAPKIESTEIYPSMGRIIGYISSGATLTGYNSVGKVDTGSLYRFLWINQLINAGDRAVGNNTSYK